MDPKANLKEQIELAQAIITACDAAQRMGWISTELESQAEELARLVLAMNEWRTNGGFDPYQHGWGIR